MSWKSLWGGDRKSLGGGKTKGGQIKARGLSEAGWAPGTEDRYRAQRSAGGAPSQRGEWLPLHVSSDPTHSLVPVLCAGDRAATAGLARLRRRAQAVRWGRLLAFPGGDWGEQSCRVRSVLGVPPEQAVTDQLPANKATHVHACASTTHAAQSTSRHVCTRAPGRECPVARTQLSPRPLGEGGILPLPGVSGHPGQSLEAGSPNQRPYLLRLGPRQRRIREVRPQVSLGDFSRFPAWALWRGSPSKQPWGKVLGC